MSNQQSNMEAYRDFLLDAWELPGKVIIYVDGGYADSICQFFLENKVECGPRTVAFNCGLQIYRSRDGQLKPELNGTVYMFEALITKEQFFPLANAWFLKTFKRRIISN
jgi:hypothetical protein